MAKKRLWTITEIIDRFDDKKSVLLSAREQAVILDHLKECYEAQDKSRKLCYDFASCGVLTKFDMLRMRANRLIGFMQNIERYDD